MHELSVMTQVVDSILRLANERRASKILSVRLEIGDLTFLASEQLEFAFEMLTKNEGPPLESAVLTIEKLGARGNCHGCGFIGPLDVVELPDSHFSTPTLDCPNCGKMVEVTEGRDLIIRDIKLEVPDGSEDQMEDGTAVPEGGGNEDG